MRLNMWAIYAEMSVNAEFRKGHHCPRVYLEGEEADRKVVRGMLPI